MQTYRYLKQNNGFTIIEMLIVLVIFSMLMIITAKAFDIVLTKSAVISKSEESNIEGVVGLEMFRHDLEQTGFGLFTETDSVPPTYDETAVSTIAADYNDSPNNIPRALVGGNNLNKSDDSIILTGTDYLAIKATTVSRSKVAQKWTYINGIGSSKVWGTNDFTTSDYVIAVRQTFANSELKRKLIYSPPSSFSVTYKTAASSYVNPFGPPSDAVQYFYYGIDDNLPRAPFNRTDYVVKRVAGDSPKSCATGSGVLYKATMNQSTSSSGGGMVYIPLIDCVADMQVVLGWNTGSPPGPTVDTYTNADGSAQSGSANPVSMTDPVYIRQHLKLIKVYILAQDGGLDKNFKNTETNMVVGDHDLGEDSLTKTVDLTSSNFLNYRWKLYRIVVKPKNII